MAVRRVSATEALPLQQVGFVFLDIRTPQEYRKGHPKGAVNLPYKFYNSSGGYKPNPKFMEVMTALYPTSTKLLVVGKIGKRSLKAAEELDEAGYELVNELRPGYIGLLGPDGKYLESGWTTMGLASEKVTDGGSWDELCEKAGG